MHAAGPVHGDRDGLGLHAHGRIVAPAIAPTCDVALCGP